jgi:hypothetical protein
VSRKKHLDAFADASGTAPAQPTAPEISGSDVPAPDKPRWRTRAEIASGREELIKSIGKEWGVLPKDVRRVDLDHLSRTGMIETDIKTITHRPRGNNEASGAELLSEQHGVETDPFTTRVRIARLVPQTAKPKKAPRAAKPATTAPASEPTTAATPEIAPEDMRARGHAVLDTLASSRAEKLATLSQAMWTRKDATGKFAFAHGHPDRAGAIRKMAEDAWDESDPGQAYAKKVESVKKKHGIE